MSHLKPRKPLKKVSDSRAQESKEYPKLKREFFKTHQRCFVCGEVVVPEKKQLHHFFGRIQELLCWVPGFRLACPWCHNYIETHRKEAIEQGWRADERLFNRPSLVIHEKTTTA